MRHGGIFQLAGNPTALTKSPPCASPPPLVERSRIIGKDDETAIAWSRSRDLHLQFVKLARFAYKEKCPLRSDSTTFTTMAPRIVPAIPHRLTRAVPAARPVPAAPAEPSRSTVSKISEPNITTEEQAQPEQPASPTPNVPHTPASPKSGAQVDHTETSLAASPAKSDSSELEHGPKEVSNTNGTAQLNGFHADDTSSGAEVKPVQNGTHRKLTIPAELPPPFYPANRQRTVNEHDAQPDGLDSQHNENGQVIEGRPTPNGHFTPNYPPGFASEEAAFFHGQQSHHMSEAAAPWAHHSQNVSVSHPPQVATSYPYTTQGDGFPVTAHANMYTEAALPLLVPNGTGSGRSLSPSRPQHIEQSFGSERGEDIVAPHQNGSSFKAEPMDEALLELATYLLGQVGNPDFADFVLQVRTSEAILTSIPVHGIVVARSPVLADAINRSIPVSHRPRETRRLLDVVTMDLSVTRQSIEEAVRVLYGAPLLSGQIFLYGLAPEVPGDTQVSSPDAARRMREILSYIAAGKVLQLPILQLRGVDIARALLRWDTIEQVLQFALRHSMEQNTINDNVNLKDPVDMALLHSTIDFISHAFPTDFTLYSIAPELQDISRLPSTFESRPPTHNPRLSKIRFGDAPLEDELKPTFAARILSSILMTLPLALVDRILNHPATANQLGWSRVVNVMEEVVRERENRRKKAATGNTNLPRDGALAEVMSSRLHTMESVKKVQPSHLHPSGCMLVSTPAEV